MYISNNEGTGSEGSGKSENDCPDLVESESNAGVDYPALVKQSCKGKPLGEASASGEKKANIRKHKKEGKVGSLSKIRQTKKGKKKDESNLMWTEEQLVKFDIPRCTNPSCLFEELFVILRGFPLTHVTYMRLWRNFTLRPTRTRLQKAKAIAILDHLKDMHCFREVLSDQLVAWNKKVDQASPQTPRLAFKIECLQQNRIKRPPYLKRQSHIIAEETEAERSLYLPERVMPAWLPVFLRDPPLWEALETLSPRPHNLPEGLEMVMNEVLPPSRHQ